MIIGTAGHIDHGKTSLVAALTGVDTDRLPEEKRRGISIELGYAYLEQDGTSLGFIDVPGHEKLVHTMLAGATGIDHALLVVAADDGVMPQTREHLAILSLLGISSGVVAITKADRVDDDRLARVEDEVRELVARSPLAAAPMHRVSSVTRDGIDDLREALVALDRAPGTSAAASADFRLAVDRSFTIEGIGTIVTGSVHSGSIDVGSVVRLARTGQELRVRSLHAQNHAAEHGEAGQRCALNLAGIGKDDVHRGDWIVASPTVAETARIDASITVWRDEPGALQNNRVVHVHLGAATTLARVAILGDAAIAPGQTGLVQLILDAPIAAWQHDRIVLRDASATRTIGGGHVLDPHGPQRYRRSEERLALLDALHEADASTRLARVLAVSPLGIGADDWRRDSALAADSALPASALSLGNGAQRWLLDRGALRDLRTTLLDALLDYHARAPDELGLDIARLRRLAMPRVPPPLFLQLVEALIVERALARRGAWLHLPEHEVRLSADDLRIGALLLPRLKDGRFDPPWVRDLARDTRMTESAVRDTLIRLARRGDVFQVVRDLYYDASVIEQLALIAREVAETDGEIRAARFRDRTSLGRKRAIQILEFFDRVGFSRRVRDQHLLRPGTVMFCAAPAVE
ncbi:selenocysteine-specific translation elongation factor [soil metagenome]